MLTNEEFTSRDRLVSLDGSVDVINANIQWHYANTTDGVTEEYRHGFINGMIEAKRLIITRAQVLFDEGISDAHE